MSARVNKYLAILFVYGFYFNPFVWANVITNETEWNISTTSDSLGTATSSDIYTTYQDTNESNAITITSASPSDCVLTTKDFFYGLDGIWRQYELVNDREAYVMEWGMYGFAMAYLYWDIDHSSWRIGSSTSIAYYSCTQQLLADCIAGSWVYSSGVDDNATLNIEGDCHTPTPTLNDCTPYIKTLNFYDVEMDGIWLWNDANEEYRHNISGSAGYYKMYQPYTYWYIHEVYSNGEMSDYLTFCMMEDLTECAGNWLVWDDGPAEWVYHSEATLQLVDCAYSECDVIGQTEEETACMLFLFVLAMSNETITLYVVFEITVYVSKNGIDDANCRCNQSHPCLVVHFCHLGVCHPVHVSPACHCMCPYIYVYI